MNVIVTESYEASAAWVADQICARIAAKPDAKLGLATGGTPVPVYRALIEACKEGRADFSAVRTVNLDEYWGLQPDNDQSYRYFMDTNLFDHINIKKENTYVASGLGDPQANCRALDAAVLEGGAPDLQLLGIGANGHIAFNDPHVADFDDKAAVKVVALDETCRQQQVNDGCFARLDDVPTHALTLTIPTLTAPEAVFCIVPAKTKANAVYAALRGGITEACPASILRRHANATLYCDADSAARVL